MAGSNQPVYAFADCNIITLKVGPKPTVFRVHEGILCAHSKFFEAALRHDRFNEGITKAVELPEESPAVFEQFLKWLYQGESFLDEFPVTDLELQLKLYILTDSKDIPELKKCILAAIHDDTLMDVYWGPETFFDVNESVLFEFVKLIYQHLPDGDELKEIMLKRFIRHTIEDFDFSAIKSVETKNRLAEIPKFAADLSFALCARLHKAV